MRRSFNTVRLLSSAAVAVLFYVAFVLLTLEPLAKNTYARSLAVEIRMLDPKIQRAQANGTLEVSHSQFATSFLETVNHYKYIPISIVFVSIIVTLVGLWTAKYNHRMSANIFMFASLLSLLTVLPAILQAISGYLMFKKAKIDSL